MERKQFLKVVSTGVVGGSLIPLLHGCASYRYINGTMQGNQLVVSKMEFEKEDDFILVKNPRSSAPIYLRKDQEENFIALLLECTHKQCTVNPAGGTFDCPCHGSRYDLQGKVLKGPARRKLLQYKVEPRGEEIFIQLQGGV